MVRAWQHNADKSVQSTVHITHRCSVVISVGDSAIRGGTAGTNDTFDGKQELFGIGVGFRLSAEMATMQGMGTGSASSDHGKIATAMTPMPLPAVTATPLMSRTSEWQLAQQIGLIETRRGELEIKSERNQYQRLSVNQLTNSIIGGRFHAPTGGSTADASGRSRNGRSAVC